MVFLFWLILSDWFVWGVLQVFLRLLISFLMFRLFLNRCSLFVRLLLRLPVKVTRTLTLNLLGMLVLRLGSQLIFHLRSLGNLLLLTLIVELNSPVLLFSILAIIRLRVAVVCHWLPTSSLVISLAALELFNWMITFFDVRELIFRLVKLPVAWWCLWHAEKLSQWLSEVSSNH